MSARAGTYRLIAEKGSTRTFKTEPRRLSRVRQVTDLNFVPLAFAQGLIPELQGWAFRKSGGGNVDLGDTRNCVQLCH